MKVEGVARAADVQIGHRSSLPYWEGGRPDAVTGVGDPPACPKRQVTDLGDPGARESCWGLHVLSAVPERLRGPEGPALDCESMRYFPKPPCERPPAHPFRQVVGNAYGIDQRRTGTAAHPRGPPSASAASVIFAVGKCVPRRAANRTPWTRCTGVCHLGPTLGGYRSRPSPIAFCPM